MISLARPCLPRTVLVNIAPTANLSDALRRLLGSDRVLDAHSDLAVYECDAFVIENHCPSVAVFPQTTGEVAAIVGLCNEHRVPFVPLTERIGAEVGNIYKPAASDPWTWDGEIYGLGNELNAVVLTYRQDILDELGVETPFETWDQVIEAGKQIAADGETKTFALHDIAFGDWFQMAQVAGT